MESEGPHVHRHRSIRGVKRARWRFLTHPSRTKVRGKRHMKLIYRRFHRNVRQIGRADPWCTSAAFLDVPPNAPSTRRDEEISRDSKTRDAKVLPRGVA